MTDDIVMDLLPDGQRLNLRNGPIDLIVEATGAPSEVAAAYQQTKEVFPNILNDLVAEVDLLRAQIKPPVVCPTGRIAKAMVSAAAPLAAQAFVTPMICVAGAVADHVLAALIRGRRLDRAYVNNGGDIAIHLAPGQIFDVGICGNIASRQIASIARISADDGIGGVATSGWQGRSHSLGIADAVTVLAENAAMADAAATLIANAIDLPDHDGIRRVPASDLSPDSDLGNRPVTTQVVGLTRSDASLALGFGQDYADDLIKRGHIVAAYGNLMGQDFSTEGEVQNTAMSGPVVSMLTRSDCVSNV